LLYKILFSNKERGKMSENMKKVYVAAPIVSATDEMKAQIQGIISKLRAEGYDVHDPSHSEVPNEDGMTMDEWARCVFTMDVIAINNSSWVVVCDFGRHGTAGTAWETGYAYGIKKNILVIHMNNKTDYSVMMRGCSTNYSFFDEFMKEKSSDVFFCNRREMPSKLVLN
jgi:nucleoside 2-deoxyribosyltransferase